MGLVLQLTGLKPFADLSTAQIVVSGGSFRGAPHPGPALRGGPENLSGQKGGVHPWRQQKPPQQQHNSSRDSRESTTAASSSRLLFIFLSIFRVALNLGRSHSLIQKIESPRLSK